MITCVLKYTIVPSLIAEFESYAKLWVPLVNRFGGDHHGYFLPAEGASDTALALFSFPSLAAYESYRERSINDAECSEAYRFGEETGCIRSYERSFFRPLDR